MADCITENSQNKTIYKAMLEKVSDDVEHISQGNTGNTDSISSIPKYSPTDNPISQVYMGGIY